MAGIVGALLTGVFASKAVNPAGADGLLAGNAALVGIQLLAVVATIVFAGVASFGILTIMRLLMPLRVPVDAEARQAMIEFLDEQLGTNDVARAGSYLETPLRLLVHLIMSSPEYQLG